MSDIRIKTTDEFRRRVKRVKAEEGMTYEELLRALLDFRANNPDRWEARSERSRRSSGARKG